MSFNLKSAVVNMKCPDVTRRTSDYEARNLSFFLSVCGSHVSRTVHPIYFILGRFVAEDSKKCSGATTTTTSSATQLLLPVILKLQVKWWGGGGGGGGYSVLC